MGSISTEIDVQGYKFECCVKFLGSQIYFIASQNLEGCRIDLKAPLVLFNMKESLYYVFVDEIVINNRVAAF